MKKTTAPKINITGVCVIIANPTTSVARAANTLAVGAFILLPFILQTFAIFFVFKLNYQ
jgi:hypothetical protein